MRSLAVAKTQIQGAHPKVLRSRFFDKYATGAKEGFSWWPRTQRAYPSFSVTEGEELGLGDEGLERRGKLVRTERA